MKEASAAVLQEKPLMFEAILWGGLIAGLLDITYASVASWLRGRGPVTVLQSVASGVLGANAFTGGLWAAALGAALHFLIAIGAAVVYYVASRKFDFLVQRAVICGLLYGIVVYLIMHFVVVPLSAAPFKMGNTLTGLITGLIVHMLLIGLPISLVVRKFSR